MKRRFNIINISKEKEKKMYKTTWMIRDNDNDLTKLTYYHFGKNPQFPSWYMENNQVYEVEMLGNFKLLHTPKLFFKCLTHFWKIS